MKEEAETPQKSPTEIPETPVAEEASDNEQEREAWAKEKEDLHNQLLRAVADLQNFKRRAMQEKIELQKFATEHLILSLLPVLDNFERTIAAAKSGATQDALIEGIEAVDAQFRSVLGTLDLKRIEALNTEFDPNRHDAVVTYETHELPENTITDEISPGYEMAGKVIRPARVRVTKKP